MKLTWRRYRGAYTPSKSKPLMSELPLDLQQDLAMEDNCWILTQVKTRIRSVLTTGQCSLLSMAVQVCVFRMPM